MKYEKPDMDMILSEDVIVTVVEDSYLDPDESGGNECIVDFTQNP